MSGVFGLLWYISYSKKQTFNGILKVIGIQIIFRNNQDLYYIKNETFDNKKMGALTLNVGC